MREGNCTPSSASHRLRIRRSALSSKKISTAKGMNVRDFTKEQRYAEGETFGDRRVNGRELQSRGISSGQAIVRRMLAVGICSPLAPITSVMVSIGAFQAD